MHSVFLLPRACQVDQSEEIPCTCRLVAAKEDPRRYTASIALERMGSSAEEGNAAVVLEQNRYVLTRIVNLGWKEGEDAAAERDAVTAQVLPALEEVVASTM